MVTMQHCSRLADSVSMNVALLIAVYFIPIEAEIRTPAISMNRLAIRVQSLRVTFLYEVDHTFPSRLANYAKDPQLIVVPVIIV